MNSTGLSREIRSQLAIQRISVISLATELGVCRATVSRRLADTTVWPLDDAFKAAKFLGISDSVICADMGVSI